MCGAGLSTAAGTLDSYIPLGNCFLFIYKPRGDKKKNIICAKVLIRGVSAHEWLRFMRRDTPLSETAPINANCNSTFVSKGKVYAWINIRMGEGSAHINR